MVPDVTQPWKIALRNRGGDAHYGEQRKGILSFGPIFGIKCFPCAPFCYKHHGACPVKLPANTCRHSGTHFQNNLISIAASLCLSASTLTASYFTNQSLVVHRRPPFHPVKDRLGARTHKAPKWKEHFGSCSSTAEWPKVFRSACSRSPFSSVKSGVAMTISRLQETACKWTI